MNSGVFEFTSIISLGLCLKSCFCSPAVFALLKNLWIANCSSSTLKLILFFRIEYIDGARLKFRRQPIVTARRFRGKFTSFCSIS